MLPAYLESKASDYKEFLDLNALDSLVRSELKMDMRDKDSKSRVKSFFIDYHALLPQKRSVLGDKGQPESCRLTRSFAYQAKITPRSVII